MSTNTELVEQIISEVNRLALAGHISELGITGEAMEAIRFLAQASQARMDGGADLRKTVRSFLKAAMSIEHERMVGRLSPQSVWEQLQKTEDRLFELLATPPGNATQAAGALHLGFCLDADDTFHATLICKEDDGTATVLMSNYCHIEKGRDYLMTASPAAELKKD